MILDPLHGPSLVPDVPPQQTVISQPPGVLALPQRHPELLLALDELLEVCLAYLHPPSIGRTPHRPRRNLQVGGPVRGCAAAAARRSSRGKRSATSRDLATSSSSLVNKSLNQGRLATNSTVRPSSPISYNRSKPYEIGRELENSLLATANALPSSAIMPRKRAGL
jgi:hypothetical protein